jgi:hypothetical protein
MTIPHKAFYRKCKEKVSWREVVRREPFVQGSWRFWLRAKCLARFLPQIDIYGIGIKIVILPEWSLARGHAGIPSV